MPKSEWEGGNKDGAEAESWQKAERFHVAVVNTDPILQADTWTLQVTASFRRTKGASKALDSLSLSQSPSCLVS